MSDVKIWNIKNINYTNERTMPYALIVLNRPLKFQVDDFLQLWNRAAIRVLVDGGANHWFDFITKNQLIDCIEHPHFLTGDMDSITDASKQRLKTMNCEEIKTPDQNESDCPKSLIAIQPYLESKKVEFIEILTDFGGRIDQTMSQIDALFKHPIPNHIDIYLKSHKSIAWLLFPGNHEIIVPEVFVIRQLFCSYIPMDGSCKVTTDGLKWDLSNETVGFGKFLSTSNTYVSSIVNIHCDGHLFWSMGTCKE